MSIKKSPLLATPWRSEVLSAAAGRLPCDLILKNARVLNVFSNEWLKQDLAIYQGMIIGIEENIGLKAKRTIDLEGKSLVPGFIDAHVHIESSLLTPYHFEEAVLPKGTTSAICDPHELANVMGVEGLQYFLEASQQLSLTLKVMLSSCVPATNFETNGGGVISSDVLEQFRNHPNALGLAEVMNVPGVLFEDEDLHRKLSQFQGSPIDGHAPQVRGQALSSYIAMGINSCHESSELEEAREKLRKGMAVWIREGSVAKDLKTLLPLLNSNTTHSIGFCTDDRNPLDISHEGHLDYLIRTAIQSGIDPAIAYRSASWSVARHYGLDRLTPKSHTRIGAIAPGFMADLVILNDERTCHIHSVLKSGQLTDEIEPTGSHKKLKPRPTIQAQVPSIESLAAPTGRVHVIGVIPSKIITENRVMNSTDRGVAQFSILERYGRNAPPANAYVYGFGEIFKGAIASSVGHDSHNLAVVGSSRSDMRAALQSLIDSQGGFTVVQDGKVLAHLALPFGGLMSEASPGDITRALLQLREASRAIGCELAEPFLQLAFLCLPVIPALKLTDKGLFDVEQFKIISVSA